MSEHAATRTELYARSLPWNWWLRNRRYLLYMLRELSAVFAASWALLFLTQLPLMAGGPAAHAAWLAAIRSPGWVVFSLVALVFVVYHAWTAFTATGVLVYLRPGRGRAVPRSALNAVMFLAWAGATLVVAIILVVPAIGG